MYIILTQAQADKISYSRLNKFIGINAHAGKLLDGTYALPKKAIVDELRKYGLLKKVKAKLDITKLAFRTVADNEWDRTGWDE